MDHNTLSYIHSLITCIYTLAGGTLQAHALCPCLFGQEQPSLSIAVSNTRLEEAWTERGRKAWCPLYRFESDMYIYIFTIMCIYIYAYVSVISVYHILSVYLSSVYLSISLKSLKPNEYSLDTWLALSLGPWLCVVVLQLAQERQTTKVTRALQKSPNSA